MIELILRKRDVRCQSRNLSGNGFRINHVKRNQNAISEIQAQGLVLNNLKSSKMTVVDETKMLYAYSMKACSRDLWKVAYGDGSTRYHEEYFVRDFKMIFYRSLEKQMCIFPIVIDLFQRKHTNNFKIYIDQESHVS